jgi:ribosomal protein L35
MFSRVVARLATRATKSMIAPKLQFPTTTTTTRFLTTQSRFPTMTPTRHNLLPQHHIDLIKPQQPQFTLTTTQTAQFHIKLKINRHKRDRIGYRSRPHHASVKRFWQTGSGRLMRFKSGLNHKRRRKTKNQLRRLNKTAEVPKQSYRRLTLMMMLRPHAQFPPGMSRPVSKYWQPPKDAAKIKAKRWC